MGGGVNDVLHAGFSRLIFRVDPALTASCLASGFMLVESISNQRALNMRDSEWDSFIWVSEVIQFSISQVLVLDALLLFRM